MPEPKPHRRAQFREIPTRIDERAVERIVAAVGSAARKPLTPLRRKALMRRLNFERVHLASFEVDDATAYRTLIQTTPLNQFLGSDLALVFRRWFGRREGRSRPYDPENRGSTPHGPYVRFAIAVMEEFGQKISPHTIDAAIRAVRARNG